MALVTIRDIRAFCIRPAGFNLVIVKLETSEPGLYGLGCATFPYHFNAVKSVIEEYYKPLLLGRDVSRIEEIWNMLHVASYWRTGPVTNNAIGGVDIALWDIKGKMAGMSIHDLLGGKTRMAVPVYRYAQSGNLDAIVEQALALKESGVQYIRIQWNNYNTPEIRGLAPEKAPEGYYFNPQKYCSDTVKLFKTVREAVGDEVELCHDVHERIPPSQALWLVKALELYRPYFLEDIFSPEQAGWFRLIRPQTSMPLAMGELFTNPVEWEDLIKERLIDFIRVHVSQIGGITAAKKLASFAEQFGIRTAWHGSPDMSPIGHAVNVQLDMAVTNFGIQEWPDLNSLLYEMFPGTPVIKGAYAYMDDKPGIGVEFDEALAKKYPAENYKTDWLEMRRPDGSMQLP
jgi:mannonate dehydratase